MDEPMSDDATHYERLEGSHLCGQVTDAIVQAEFLRRGILVLTPAYDNDPYDLVIDLDEEFHRL
jgi:hypothetical protein